MTTVERIQRVGPRPVRFRQLEVLRVQPLGPRMVRITFGSPDLEGFASDAPDDHVKVTVPADGQHRAVSPVMTPEGLRFLEDGPKPELREYTPRRYRPELNELDIDFVIHGDGPASTWAARAEVGDVIGVGGPRGSMIVADDFDWYFLIVDETGLPAVARRIEEAAPGTKIVAVIEVVDQEDEQELNTAADVHIEWVHRGNSEPGTNKHLRQRLATLPLPDGEPYVFVAAEASVVKDLRAYLTEARGLSFEWSRCTGYWRKGSDDYDAPH